MWRQLRKLTGPIVVVGLCVLLLGFLGFSSDKPNKGAIRDVISEMGSPIGTSFDRASIPDSNNAEAGAVHYESVDETISRIKRDVIVTGSILSVPGQESAFFQIEGLPDRQFEINGQLMDGFVIKQITPHEVVLKNQIGEETFSLYY